MTDEQLAAVIAQSTAQAIASALPAMVEQVVAQLTPNRPATETQLIEIEPDPATAANLRSVRAAQAEAERWAAMPADELARHEATAARTRYTDAIVDVLNRDGDPGALAELAEPLTPDDITACQTDAHRRLADDPAAQAAIDAGLKPRADELAELLTAVNDGKATVEQRRRLARLVTGR